MQFRPAMIVVILAVFFLASCSKEGTLTGNAVNDQPNPQAGPSDSKPSTQSSGAPKTSSAAETTDPNKQSTLPSDVKAPDYSSLKGSCLDDGSGTVRVIDESGQKTVYRTDCLGDKLVQYSCKDKELDTKLTTCPNGCAEQNYVGKCN